jgi:hypothetical protein
MKNILKNKKSLLAFVLLVFLLVPIGFCYAKDTENSETMKNTIDLLLGNLADVVVAVCGWILQGVIAMIISFANYSDFVNNQQVKEAWIIVRDLCNMFFVLILLFIAFAVILRVESYNIKKSLPKLLLMAILINFSRTICGILIDFSQVIMLTFVKAFTSGGGNFHNALQVKEFLSVVATENAQKVSAADAAVYYIIASIFMIISVVVMVAILIAFLMRIVMFWIYIVLSPLTFLLSSFSAGQKYASQFWGEFTKYLINGPVLAFFVWMSLMVLSSLDTGDLDGGFEHANLSILQSDNLSRFIMAIGMLVGGLIVSSQIGGVGASWGANTVSSMKNRGISFAKGTARKGVGIVTSGAKGAGSRVLDTASLKTDMDLNLSRGYKRFKDTQQQKKVNRAQDIEDVVLKKAQSGGRMAALTHGGIVADNLGSWKGIKRIARGKGGIEKDQKALSEAKQKRSSLMTEEEASQKQNKLSEVNVALKDNRAKTNEAGKELEEAIKNGDQDKQTEAEKRRENLLMQRRNLKKRKDELQGDLENKQVAQPERIEEIDQKISDLTSSLNAVQGLDNMAAQKRAEIEDREKGKISNIDSSDKLGEMLSDAIKEGNQGLIAAITKKMTQAGDYGDMLKKFGHGTGVEGMQNFAKAQLQGQAKMSEQDSLGLIAELGNLAKNNNQYGAFGAAKMEDGKWRKASHEEAQTAQLSQMMKLTPKEFSRKVDKYGLGEYKNGSRDKDGWQLSDAATAYIKVNQNLLSNQYKETGQQNAIEHLAAATEKLQNNQIGDNFVTVVKERASEVGVGDEDRVEAIKS